ncbi:hypothetical protein HK102_004386 [Quaeritorhiza haematococci]|nr:hypothetical protein HK102_004386 [Quaeritorhiza haematococci]
MKTHHHKHAQKNSSPQRSSWFGWKGPAFSPISSSSSPPVASTSSTSLTSYGSESSAQNTHGGEGTTPAANLNRDVSPEDKLVLGGKGPRSNNQALISRHKSQKRRPSVRQHAAKRLGLGKAVKAISEQSDRSPPRSSFIKKTESSDQDAVHRRRSTRRRVNRRQPDAKTSNSAERESFDFEKIIDTTVAQVHGPGSASPSDIPSNDGWRKEFHGAGVVDRLGDLLPNVAQSQAPNSASSSTAAAPDTRFFTFNRRKRKQRLSLIRRNVMMGHARAIASMPPTRVDDVFKQLFLDQPSLGNIADRYEEPVQQGLKTTYPEMSEASVEVGIEFSPRDQSLYMDSVMFPPRTSSSSPAVPDNLNTAVGKGSDSEIKDSETASLIIPPRISSARVDEVPSNTAPGDCGNDAEIDDEDLWETEDEDGAGSTRVELHQPAAHNAFNIFNLFLGSSSNNEALQHRKTEEGKVDNESEKGKEGTSAPIPVSSPLLHFPPRSSSIAAEAPSTTTAEAENPHQHPTTQIFPGENAADRTHTTSLSSVASAGHDTKTDPPSISFSTIVNLASWLQLPRRLNVTSSPPSSSPPTQDGLEIPGPSMSTQTNAVEGPAGIQSSACLILPSSSTGAESSTPDDSPPQPLESHAKQHATSEQQTTSVNDHQTTIASDIAVHLYANDHETLFTIEDVDTRASIPAASQVAGDCDRKDPLFCDVKQVDSSHQILEGGLPVGQNTKPAVSDIPAPTLILASEVASDPSRHVTEIDFGSGLRTGSPVSISEHHDRSPSHSPPRLERRKRLLRSNRSPARSPRQQSQLNQEAENEHGDDQTAFTRSASPTPFLSGLEEGNAPTGYVRERGGEVISSLKRRGAAKIQRSGGSIGNVGKDRRRPSPSPSPRLQYHMGSNTDETGLIMTHEPASEELWKKGTDNVPEEGVEGGMGVYANEEMAIACGTAANAAESSSTAGPHFASNSNSHACGDIPPPQEDEEKDTKGRPRGKSVKRLRRRLGRGGATGEVTELTKTELRRRKSAGKSAPMGAESGGRIAGETGRSLVRVDHRRERMRRQTLRKKSVRSGNHGVSAVASDSASAATVRTDDCVDGTVNDAVVPDVPVDGGFGQDVDQPDLIAPSENGHSTDSCSIIHSPTFRSLSLQVGGGEFPYDATQARISSRPASDSVVSSPSEHQRHSWYGGMPLQLPEEEPKQTATSSYVDRGLGASGLKRHRNLTGGKRTASSVRIRRRATHSEIGTESILENTSVLVTEGDPAPDGRDGLDLDRARGKTNVQLGAAAESDADGNTVSEATPVFVEEGMMYDHKQSVRHVVEDNHASSPKADSKQNLPPRRVVSRLRIIGKRVLMPLMRVPLQADHQNGGHK